MRLYKQWRCLYHNMIIEAIVVNKCSVKTAIIKIKVVAYFCLLLYVDYFLSGCLVGLFVCSFSFLIKLMLMHFYY